MLDDDFGYDAPARKKAPRKPRAAAPGKKKKKGRRFDISANQVARYGAIGMSVTVVVGIMVNALLMQKGRHPAPLFGNAAVPLNGSVAAASPKAPAAISQRTAATEPAATSPEGAMPSEIVKADRMPAQRTATDMPGDDPIARLLNGSGVPSSADRMTGGKTVLSVQRALAKLGFVVKATGSFGPATKKAIESFEKDRHLPVKGEMSHRMVKVLAAESGMRIE